MDLALHQLARDSRIFRRVCAEDGAIGKLVGGKVFVNGGVGFAAEGGAKRARCFYVRVDDGSEVRFRVVVDNGGIGMPGLAATYQHKL